MGGTKLKNHCISMFSGGRDSTAAVARLHAQGLTQTLVTISSAHLVGISAVKQRLKELSLVLPPSTEWHLIRQPEELRTDVSFYKKTCLPCHHSYVVVGAITAFAFQASTLSFGYAGYQRHWPEQTPLAVESLSRVLSRFGIELTLPVYAVSSKVEIEEELRRLGLSAEALEQKCLQQVYNEELAPTDLQAQISLWERAIETSIENHALISRSIVESGTLGSFSR